MITGLDFHGTNCPCLCLRCRAQLFSSNPSSIKSMSISHADFCTEEGFKRALSGSSGKNSTVPGRIDTDLGGLNFDAL